MDLSCCKSSMCCFTWLSISPDIRAVWSSAFETRVMYLNQFLTENVNKQLLNHTNKPLAKMCAHMLTRNLRATYAELTPIFWIVNLPDFNSTMKTSTANKSLTQLGTFPCGRGCLQSSATRNTQKLKPPYGMLRNNHRMFVYEQEAM